MKERIHMRADVIKHRNEIGLECHRILRRPEIERLGRFMREMGGDHGQLKQLMCRHVVLNQKTEVDYAFGHCTLLQGCQDVSGFFQRNASSQSAIQSLLRQPPKVRSVYTPAS